MRPDREWMYKKYSTGEASCSGGGSDNVPEHTASGNEASNSSERTMSYTCSSGGGGGNDDVPEHTTSGNDASTSGERCITSDACGNPESSLTLVKGHLWVDETSVVGRVRESLQSFYDAPYTSWSNVPDYVRDIWWQEFQRHFKWAPEHAADVKRAYISKAKERLKDLVYKTKVTIYPPRWISKQVLEELDKVRASEKFQKRSKKCSDASRLTGPHSKNLHTQGSVSTKVVKRRMTKELNRSPTVVEVFEKTHKRKDGALVQGKAQQVWDKYQKLVHENETKDPDNQESEEKMFLDAVGGWTKNRTVYGIGNAVEDFYTKPPRKSSTTKATLEQRVEQQATALQAQQEQIERQQRMIEGLTQVMLRFSQDPSCFMYPFNNLQLPPPPPPPGTSST